MFTIIVEANGFEFVSGEMDLDPFDPLGRKEGEIVQKVSLFSFTRVGIDRDTEVLKRFSPKSLLVELKWQRKEGCFTGMRKRMCICDRSQTLKC